MLNQLPFSVRVTYGDGSHEISQHAEISEAEDAMRVAAEDYAAEGGGVAVTDETRWNAHVNEDGHTVARWRISRRLGVADLPIDGTDPDEVAAARVVVNDLVAALVSRCAELEVDDYRGESVNFLGALLEWAQTPGLSTYDAVRAAYGMNLSDQVAAILQSRG